MPIDELNGYYYDPNDPDELGDRISVQTKYHSYDETDDKWKMGYAIQAKDVIMLDAPKVFLSPKTPLKTVAQDIAGAINELGGFTEDALFSIPIYSIKYVSGVPTAEEKDIVKLKLIKGPSYSGYYERNTAPPNIDYDYVSETYPVYNDPEDPNKQTGVTTRTVYLHFLNRDTPNEQCVSMYFSKWGLYNDVNWYNYQKVYIDRYMNIYGYG